VSYLAPILESTRTRVLELKQRVSGDVLEQRLAAAAPARGLAAALGGTELAVIAEIKRVSPAAGPLNRDLNAAQLAAAYAEGGAAAISVLTEPDHFEGSGEDLQAALGAGLPVLRKDFIIDELQVLESRAMGADALLLIVRVLGDRLRELVAATEALGMDALVEVHDRGELAEALEAGAKLVGINQRDLETFEIVPGLAGELAEAVPADSLSVALSGVSDRAGMERLAAAGVDAVLVGEALVRAGDPAAKLQRLRGQVASS
jgi:indole-3-glycerol phosphate synthase